MHSADCSVAYNASFRFPAIVREPAEGVEELIALVGQSELPVKRMHPLLATLEAARASFERENLRARASARSSLYSGRRSCYPCGSGLTEHRYEW